MAVEKASFRTSMDWISEDGMSLMDSTGKPSTMYSGLLSWVMELPPRTRILTSASGSPSVVTTETPAIFPERAWETEVTGCSVSLSEPTEATAPRRSRRLTVW